MATFRAYKKSDGSTMYRAEIVKKHKGKIIHRESQAFSKKTLAQKWASKRERDLEAESVDGKTCQATVGDLIEAYLAEYGDKFGRTKRTHLQQMLTMDLAVETVRTLTARRIIAHIRERLRTVRPQTANNDVIWLGVVLRYGQVALDAQPNLDELEKALNFLREENMVGRSEPRKRRPTRAELWALSRYFGMRRRQIPMLEIMWFAIFSSRREAEITRLRWDDNNEERRTGMVRNLKHPRKRENYHRRFKYTESAWKIVQRQPRVDERIFPYNAQSISAAFTRSCRVLGIEDLRFHDLRHEATSRLFESKRYTIPEIQQFTLHDDWKNLARYTNLQPEDID